MINGKKVAIDARMIEMSGIGTYIQHLMGKNIYDYAIGKEEEIRRYDKKVKIIPFEASIYGLKEQLAFPNREIKKSGIEIIHFPHYDVPITYRGRFVVTVHDLTHIIMPEFLGGKIKYYYAKFLLNHAIKKSEHIFTVSENSQKDICTIFQIRKEKISITYNAVDSDFRVKEKEEIQYLYDRFSIEKNKKILLYVGNLKPHKNLSRLLDSFSKIPDKGKYCLILAGKDFSSLELKQTENKLGISDLVNHTGLVSKEELIDLYNLADLFVFPSLYEGFGIPPLEAMACGTPVICSNNSSVSEVVGEAAILFDPLNEEEMKDKIQMVIHNPVLQNELITKGQKRTNCFKWESCVEKTKSVIIRCLN